MKNAKLSRKILAISDLKEELDSEAANRRKLLKARCSSTDTSPDAVFECTNAVREDPSAFRDDYKCTPHFLSQYSSGLGALQRNSKLDNAAQSHTDDQAQRRDIGHTSSNGAKLSDRVRQVGYDYSGIGENVASGQTSALDVLMSWMCSDGHRRSVMSCSYSELGIGVKSDGRKHYYTQVFGCPRGGSCGCNGGPSSSSDKDDHDSKDDQSHSDQYDKSKFDGMKDKDGYSYGSDGNSHGYPQYKNEYGYSKGGDEYGNSKYGNQGYNSGSGGGFYDLLSKLYGSKSGYKKSDSGNYKYGGGSGDYGHGGSGNYKYGGSGDYYKKGGSSDYYSQGSDKYGSGNNSMYGSNPYSDEHHYGNPHG